MAVRRAATSKRHVFVNVPFDAAYEPLFLALVAGLVGRGFVPRSVLEIPPQRDRLRRLCDLIEACGLSVHDLSRVTLSRGNFRVPRFNMPFETGLAVAIARGAEGHQWRLLEGRPYRLQQSLSDLNGYDPAIHGDRPGGMLAAVADLFPAHEVDESHMRRIHHELKLFRRSQVGTSLYTPRAFQRLVRAAVLMVAADS